jgi:hypothetical protein
LAYSGFNYGRSIASRAIVFGRLTIATSIAHSGMLFDKLFISAIIWFPVIMYGLLFIVVLMCIKANAFAHLKNVHSTAKSQAQSIRSNASRIMRSVKHGIFRGVI